MDFSSLEKTRGRAEPWHGRTASLFSPCSMTVRNQARGVQRARAGQAPATDVSFFPPRFGWFFFFFLLLQSRSTTQDSGTAFSRCRVTAKCMRSRTLPACLNQAGSTRGGFFPPLCACLGFFFSCQQSRVATQEDGVAFSFSIPAHSRARRVRCAPGTLQPSRLWLRGVFFSPPQCGFYSSHGRAES